MKLEKELLEKELEYSDIFLMMFYIVIRSRAILSAVVLIGLLVACLASF